MPGNFTKTKVDSRIAAAAVLIATAIGVSALTATLIPQAGSGNFYASGDITVPTKPACPVDQNDSTGKYTYYCDIEKSCRYDKGTKLDEYSCTNSGDVCCKVKIDSCPAGTEKWGDYCCKPEEKAEKLGVKFCEPKDCGDGKKLCGGADKSTCCNATDGCGVATVYKLGFPVGTVAICLPKPDCDKPCGTDNDGKKVCCGDNQQCGEKNGVPFCQSSSCPTGQALCKGTGNYEGTQRCCAVGACSTYPSGAPICDN